MFVLLILSILVVFLFHELYWKRRAYPPGPLPLPLLGNALALNSPAPGYESFNKWAKKYGEIYTIWLGSTPFIMINTYEKMKETFIRNGDVYADKKSQNINQILRGGDYGVIDTNGETWRDHRRFALATLRDFGLGKGLMQDKILIEIQDVFDKFDASEGSEIDMVDHINLTIGNIINQLTFGYRFDGDREGQFHELKKSRDDLFTQIGEMQTMIEAFMPWIKYILPKPKLEKVLTEKQKAILRASGEVILLWSSVHHPKVQEKLHGELDKVVGSDRIVTTSDKNDLPYMSAFINEVQRCANISALNAVHMTTQDTVINGYPIKKGTGVIAQISTVMFDETLFPNPNSFNPDRFIDNNGKLKKIEEFTPFSVGKRQCLGEGLARMELFLYFSNVINRYEITPSEDGLPSLDKSKNTLVQEIRFKCKLAKRTVGA